MRRLAFILLFLSAFLSSCVREIDSADAYGGRSVVSFSVTADTLTRSSLSVDESAVDDITVMAYSGGVLVSARYFSDPDVAEMSLNEGMTYDFHVVANMGDVTSSVPDKASGLPDWTYSVSGLSDLAGSFPMSWSRSGVTLPSSGIELDVALVRLVSKVTFNVNTSATGLQVESVRLKQSPLSVRPFSSGGSTATSVADGDHASASDIASLNAGGIASFYMLENMQGDLLPGNSDASKKIPGNIDSKSGVCTYLEVGCRYPDGDDREGTVTYRMYLGENSTSNFDVERNRVVSVTLNTTESAISSGDDYWKIVSDYVQHAVSVTLDKDAMSLEAGQKGTLVATVLPANAVDRTVKWTTTSSSVASVGSDGTVTAVGAGTCVIRAASNDRPDIYDECVVTVTDVKLTGITPVSTSPVVLMAGDSGQTYQASFTASWSDGSTTSVESTSIDYSSSDPSVASVSPAGLITAVSAGTATVTASYTSGGISVSAQIEVRVSSIVLDIPFDSINLSSGKAVSAVVTDHTGSVLSDPAVTWKTEGTGKVSLYSTDKQCRKTLVANSAGEVTVSVSYDGELGAGTASKKVDVTNKLQSVSITNGTSAQREVGETYQCAAVAVFVSGAVTDVTKFQWYSSDETVATVKDGLVTAHKVGTATITCSYEGITSSNSLTFKVGVRTYSYSMNPETASVSAGSTTRLEMMQVSYFDGTATGASSVSSKAAWSSSDNSVATVSGGTVTGIKGGTVTITASYDGVSCTAEVTVYPKTEFVFEISPSVATVSVGGTVQLRYMQGILQDGVPSGGNDLTSNVEWSSSNDAIATVSGGKVKGVSPGTVTITAGSATATVTVSSVVTYGYRMSQASASVNTGGSVVLKVLRDTYTDGTVTVSGEDVSSLFTWSSSDNSVATVSGGKVTAVKPGTVTVTASYGSEVLTAGVTVNPVVSYELEVSPSSVSVQVGKTASVKAVYWTLEDGVRKSSSDVTASASWSSSSSSVATVSGGTVSGKASGTATVTASYDGRSATASVKVSSVVTYSLSIEPSTLSVAAGKSAGLIAKLYTTTDGSTDSGVDVTSAASWSVSSGSSYASVSGGTVTGISAGTATVKAQYNGESASATVTVTAPVPESISISGDYNRYLVIGDTAPSIKLTATVLFSDGSKKTSGISWSSSNSAVAKVSGGTVTAVSYGTAYIYASYSGLSAKADICVRVSELSVSPASSAIDVGESQTFTATLVNYSGSSVNVTAISSWSMSKSGVATASGSTFTGKASGTVTVTADYSSSKYGDGSASATLKVNDVITYGYRLVVSGASQVSVGQTAQLAARLYTDTYTNGTLTTTDIAGVATDDVTWSVSSGSSYLSVTSAGVVKGKAIGDAVVKAVWNSGSSVSDTHEVEVIRTGGITPDPGWDEDTNIGL